MHNTPDFEVVREFEQFQAYITEDVRYKMPESEFTSKFLPLVVSEHPDLVDVWRMLAGDLRYSIDVVDTNGTKLFTLPAFHAGLTTILNHGIEGGLSSLWAYIGELNKTSPAQAFVEFETTLKGVAGTNDPAQLINDVLVWYYVMRRYDVVIPRYADHMAQLDALWMHVFKRPPVEGGAAPQGPTTHAIPQDKEFEEL